MLSDIFNLFLSHLNKIFKKTINAGRLILSLTKSLVFGQEIQHAPPFAVFDWLVFVTFPYSRWLLV